MSDECHELQNIKYKTMLLNGNSKNKQIAPEKKDNIMNIEKDIMKVFKANIWLKLTYLIIEHGKSVCHKIKPKCEICILNRLCLSLSF